MNAYKTRLEEMLGAVTKELATIGIHDPHNSADWVAVPSPETNDTADENLVADGVEEWDERAGVVAELEAHFNAITAALARIEQGTFGVCTHCGVTIESARLEANPTATTCIEHREQAK